MENEKNNSLQKFMWSRAKECYISPSSSLERTLFQLFESNMGFTVSPNLSGKIRTEHGRISSKLLPNFPLNRLSKRFCTYVMNTVAIFAIFQKSVLYCSVKSYLITSFSVTPLFRVLSVCWLFVILRYIYSDM